jgi:hypothetical protein
MSGGALLLPSRPTHSWPRRSAASYSWGDVKAASTNTGEVPDQPQTTPPHGG